MAVATSRRIRMLVTFSGIVGSGKTTAARSAARALSAAGVPAEYRRFRRLPCFTALDPSRWLGRNGGGAPAPAADGDGEDQDRGQTRGGTRTRRLPLTITATLGYAARALAFRAYVGTSRGPCIVLDRYFYDSLAHYRLTGRRERLYVALLDRLIPVPDAAILLMPSPALVAARRPHYTAAYISRVIDGFDALRACCARLEPVSADDPQAVDRALATLTSRLAGAAGR
jgi:thymidylate kinase